MHSFRLVFPSLAVLVILAAIARQAEAQEPAEAPEAKPAAPIYLIDAAASDIRVLVFRKGLLSAFSHDHVLVAEGIAGQIQFDPNDVPASAVQISVPVDSLVFDDPENRRQAGYSGLLDEDDRQEVRATALSEDYLNAAEYPRVVATADHAEGELPDLRVLLNVRIKQTEKQVPVPAHVTLSGGALAVSGRFELLQSDFDVEVFSSALGTLSVEDRIEVRYAIVAHRQ